MLSEKYWFGNLLLLKPSLLPKRGAFSALIHSPIEHQTLAVSAPYAALLERYVEPPLGAKRIADVQPFDVQSLYNEMQERGLSSRTVRYTHAVLASALKQAVRWRMLRHNPCEGVELPRLASREMRALTPEEAARFLEAASQDRWGIFFLMALTTGLRPSESLGLRWSDVDLERGVLGVQRSLIWRSYRDGDWYFSEPKTTRSRRQMPLPASLWRALAEHKRKQAEERLKAGPRYKSLDLVFATRTGKPLMPHNINRQHFKPLLEEAKLPASIRLYDLRHSCATLLLAANEHPKVVSERLGHASVTLTLDTYSHVLPSMQQAASDKMESILFKKTGTL